VFLYNPTTGTRREQGMFEFQRLDVDGPDPAVVQEHDSDYVCVYD
jgi:hypothetical protein